LGWQAAFGRDRCKRQSRAESGHSAPRPALNDAEIIAPFLARLRADRLAEIDRLVSDSQVGQNPLAGGRMLVSH
jgi:hypothetical protein